MPKDKKEHVDFQRRYFDQNVEFFRKPIPEDVVERSRLIAKLIVKDKNDRILDVGTGIGAFLKYYNEQGVSYSQILACDLSTQMLAEAKMRYPEVQFWQGDIIDLPEASGSFDLVVFNACFGNIYDQQAVMKKSASLLNETGRIAISHPMGNDFVKMLKEQEPELVFTLLPDRHTLEEWANSLKMSIEIFRDEQNLYLAVLSR